MVRVKLRASDLGLSLQPKQYKHEVKVVLIARQEPSNLLGFFISAPFTTGINFYIPQYKLLELCMYGGVKYNDN